MAWVRLGKPLALLRRPYRVESVRGERGGAFTLAVAPDGHPGLRFSPGQFAWVTLFGSPFADREHPFSFSGSAEAGGRLEFTIKALGDFTRRVPQAARGERVFVARYPHICVIDINLPTVSGFELARRTVAKYREAIGIGSSVQRRRQKKMGR